MSLILMVYLASIISGIKMLLFIITFMSVMIFIFYTISIFEGCYFDEEEKINAKRLSKKSFLFALLFSLLGALTPNEKTLWVISGVYVREKMIESENFQSEQKELIELVEQKLNETQEK